MYRIYYGDEIVYDPFSPDELAFNITCYGGINDKGNMNFSIPYNHPLYNKLKIRGEEVRLLSDGEDIFTGYITQIEKDFNLTLSVKCSGILGYLGDVLIPPYTSLEDDADENTLLAPVGPAALFQWYISKYNEKATHQFRVEENDSAYLGRYNFVVRSNSSYSSAGNEIENQLLNTIGGYIFARKENGGYYISYRYDVSDVNPQIIDFGVNILDYIYTEDGEGLYTALVVTGGTTTDEDGNEIPITISGLYDTYYGDARTTNNTIVSREAHIKYGYREYHYSNTDATNGQDLYNAASAYLKIASNPSVMLVIKAVDLSLYMDEYKHLKPGEIVRVRSKPHDLDQYLVVTQIDIDLDSPGNTEYTLGVVYDTLTGEQSAKLTELNSSLNTAVDSVASLGQDVLDQAEENAKTRDDLNKLADRFESSEFDRSSFEKEVRDTILDLQKIADGAIETWFYPYPPSNVKEPTVNWKTDEEKYRHIGDLFYDTETGYAYRWLYNPDGEGDLKYSWGRIVDTDVEAALREASAAKDTADSKRRVFIETPYPPYDEGDLWAQGGNGDILVATTSRTVNQGFYRADWVYAAKYADAVYETHEEFYQSDSPTSLFGGQWETTNTWTEGKYTWRRTLITYGDGSQKYDPSEKGVCITGNTGDPGKDGENGVSITGVDVWYYLSDSSTELKGGEWVSVPPEWVEGKFMWNKTIVTYSNGKTEETTPVCIAVSGKDGKDGTNGTNGTNGKDGISVKSMKEQYYQSVSNVIIPNKDDPGWVDTYPGLSDEKPYIWTRTIITYSDGSTSQTNPICVTGPKGADGTNGTNGTNGKDGRGISSIVQHYLATNLSTGVDKNTPGWTTTIQTITADKPYLWNYETINYTTGDPTETNPAIIGRFGKDGTNGTNGTNGRGISSVTEYYLATNQSTGIDKNSTGWTTTIQVISKDKKYLWNYERIDYTDNTHTETAPNIIGVFSVDGTNGTNGRGIQKIEEWYLATSAASGVTKDTAGWTTSIQTMTITNKYLWNYEKIYYTSGDPETTTPVIIGAYGDTGAKGETGAKGDKGEEGNGIESIFYFYLAATVDTGVTKDTSGWTREVQNISVEKPYLWTYQQINYTDGSKVYTTPAVVGRFGKDGQNGKDGKDGTNGTNGTNGLDGKMLFGVSSTGSEENIKEASITGFTLYDGVCISVLFTQGNTADNPKLKVNGGTAYNIITNGSNSAYWQANETVVFVYRQDNTTWNVASSPVWASTATIGNPTSKNIYIDGNGLNFRTGTSTINATFENNKVSLGKNDSEATIGLCDDKINFRGLVNEYKTGYTGYFTVGDSEKPTSAIRIQAKNMYDNSTFIHMNAYTPDPNSVTSNADSYGFSLVMQDVTTIRANRSLGKTSLTLAGNDIYLNASGLYKSDGPSCEIYGMDVLYNSTNPNYGTITLSAAMTKYKYIDIEYCSAGDTLATTTTRVSSDTSEAVLAISATNASGNLTIYTRVIDMGVNTISTTWGGNTTRVYTSYALISSSGNTITRNTSSPNYIGILKVIGWK